MGYKGWYDAKIFHDPTSNYSIISIKTADNSIPEKARSSYRHRDHLIRFTAFGYGLPLTDAVELVLDGEWVNSGKHGMQLKIERLQKDRICLNRPTTQQSLLTMRPFSKPRPKQ